jgi:ABC-2 type transport system permease protein
MNTPSDAVPGLGVDSQAIAPAALPATRPLYWSVRRELWENRSLYIAPLIVTAVVLFGSLISMIGLPRRMRSLPTLDAAKQHVLVVRPFCVAPGPIMLATFLVALFYCLDALYGERRDRSILFWKSLPVSDLTTVLSKASVPFVVLPLLALALSVATQVNMLIVSTIVLLGSGVSPAPLWAELRFVQLPLVMLYGLLVHVLWFAPIYGWLLLVSAWAKRATFLWALFPFLGVSVLERVAFGSSYFTRMLQYRVMGAMTEAFVVQPKHGSDQILDQLTQLDPAKFLSSPGLWWGLTFAAAFLAAAVKLRRHREPI